MYILLHCIILLFLAYGYEFATGASYSVHGLSPYGVYKPLIVYMCMYTMYLKVYERKGELGREREREKERELIH